MLSSGDGGGDGRGDDDDSDDDGDDDGNGDAPGAGADAWCWRWLGGDDVSGKWYRVSRTDGICIYTCWMSFVL